MDAWVIEEIKRKDLQREERPQPHLDAPRSEDVPTQPAKPDGGTVIVIDLLAE